MSGRRRSARQGQGRPAFVGLPRHVALDLRGRELYWIESGWTPAGLRIARRGCERVAEGEAMDAFLARVSARLRLARAEVSIAVRHPDLRIERLALPKLGDRDARRVARRRLEEFVGRGFEAVSADFVLTPGKHTRPAWLVACPEEFAEVAESQWRQQGLEVGSFVALPVSLGCVARLLPPPDAEGLRALVDFGAEHATCVVTDADGWVFGRETSAKVTGDLDGPGDAEQPIDRIATELRRTFHYVRTELAAGSVAEVVISGDREDLDSLAEGLAARLDLPVLPIGDAIAEGPVARIEPGFGAALGIALHAQLGGGDLLPAASRRRRASRSARRRLSLAAAVSAVVVGLGAAHVGISVHSLRERVAALEQRWQANRAQRATAEAASAARASAEALDVARASLGTAQPPWAAVVESLGLLLPDRALVEQIRVAREGEVWLATLRVEFRGDDLGSAAGGVTGFRAALSSSPLWRVRAVEKVPSGPALPEAPYVRVHFRVEAELATGAPEIEIAAAERGGDRG